MNDAISIEEPHIKVMIQRNINLPRRLVYFDVIPDNVIGEDGELVYYEIFVIFEPFDFKVVLKEQVWKYVMHDEHYIY